ncbi:MAG: hypothetical protein N4A33_10845 [Bacteriovoracaceae bacterium]|nr:hypothetical protein [Bacteriovoracaceae bacterium]
MTKKIKQENLHWVDPKNGATFHAGIAFYDERFGEYRLILDGPRTVYSLKAFETTNNEVRYKVFAPVLIKGKFSHKVEIGYGYSNNGTNGDVYMVIGRYGQMRLVLRGVEQVSTGAVLKVA